MTVSCEMFMDCVYEEDIAMESKVWGNKERRFYKKLNKSLNKSLDSPIGRMNQLSSQKNVCKKKLAEAGYNRVKLENFLDWIEKQIHLVERSLNGSNEKRKKLMSQLYSLYKSYEKEVDKRLQSL